MNTNTTRSLVSRRRRGFTLTELVVVVAIVGLMTALMASGMERGESFATVEMSRTSVEAKFQQTTDRFRQQFMIARVDPPIDYGTRVRYMMPIDHDGNGMTYDGEGAITWGWTIDGVPALGASAWLTWVQDSTITEASIDLDVNKDGDKADSFDLGHIEEQLPDGKKLQLTGSSVLQKSGNPGGDIDEDGTLDPLFDVYDAGHSRLAHLKVFGLFRLPDGKWQTLRYDSSVRLQNDGS